jgi:2-keto-4-pentenoate hydratase/2-oxohepta-3-ene-1,7-dioic acid hydratase in catechol pathway/cyanate permease
MTLVLSLAVGGVANAMAQPSANLSISRGISTKRLGLAFGIKQSSIPAASLFGGLAVPAIALVYGWRWAFLIGALAAVALAIWALRSNARETTPAPASGNAPDRGTPRGGLWVLTLGAGLAAAAATSIGVFLVDSAVQSGTSPGAAGLLFAGAALIGLVIRVALGAAMDAFPTRSPYVLISNLLLVGTVGYTLLAVGAPAVFVVGALLAYTGGWTWPGLLHFAVVRDNRRDAASATGIVQTGLSLGSALGPFSFGILVEATSYQTAWLAAGVVAIAAALTFRIGRRMIRHSRQLARSAAPAVPAVPSIPLWINPVTPLERLPMRLCSVREDSFEFAAVIVGDRGVALIRDLVPGFTGDVLEVLTEGTVDAIEAVALAAPAAVFRPADSVTFGAPYRHPRMLWGIGLNYVEHASDLAEGVPDEPASFIKGDHTIIGPGENIPIPWQSTRTTAEAELGIVIGQYCRNVEPEDALSYVAGVVPLLDQTAEDILQRNPRFLTRSKNFPGFFAFGPSIVPLSEVYESYDSLADVTVSTVINGDVHRSNTVSNMRYDPAFLISFHSKVMPLFPGDIISTGTPGAVHIRPGDVAECRIPGIGILQNPVVDSPGTVEAEPLDEAPNRDHNSGNRKPDQTPPM